jgi:hypothetical protein
MTWMVKVKLKVEGVSRSMVEWYSGAIGLLAQEAEAWA